MTIGETFKQARKKMGLNLDEVAAKTKITKNFLEAIEGDELDRLPGEVYARHFLKIYSRLVKIDEDIVISEYHQQYGVKPHSVAHQEQTRRDDADFKRERRRNLLVVSVVVTVLVLVTLVVLYFNGSLDQFGEQKTSQKLPATETAAVVREEPVASENVTPASGTNSDAGDLPAEGTMSPVPEDELTRDESALAANSLEDSNRLEQTSEPSSGEVLDDLNQETSAPAADLGFPFVNLDSVMVVGGEAANLEDVFIIGAHEDVRVEVFIDGVSRTNRLLKKGDLRAYPFGNYHTVTIYDSSLVTIQSGVQVMRIPDREGATLSLRDWQKGELQATIDAWSSESLAESDTQ